MFFQAVANLSHLTKLLAAFDVQEETAADFESKHKNLKVIVSPCHPVTRVNPATKTVETSGGKLYGYRLLCLCHGARYTQYKLRHNVWISILGVCTIFVQLITMYFWVRTFF